MSAKQERIRQTPATMQALELRDFDGLPTSLTQVELPVPQPAANQVLIQVEATPINPSDLVFLRGNYGIKKALPVVPGLEGSGIVVAAGPGWYGRTLIGKRVTFGAADTGGGSWAEYAVTSAYRCIPLQKQVSLEQGATLLVNPLTAWAMLETIKKGRHAAAVQTAAASVLGQMVARLGQQRGIPLIHVVHRPAQVAILKELGAEYVLDSSQPDFDTRLKELCHQLKATLAFEAVGGELTGRILEALPNGSELTICGRLSGTVCQIAPETFLFHQKRVSSFWLTDWLARNGKFKTLLTMRKVQKLLDSELQTPLRAVVDLSQVPQALEDYTQHMTGGKYLIKPGLRLASAANTWQAQPIDSTPVYQAV